MRTQTDREPKEFEEKVIQVSRVSKKTKGGNKVGFSVLMVVGDKKGRVGVGLGKAPDVQSAVKKGIKKAKKKLITVPMNGTTIPFRVEVKLGAGVVMLKPAPKGSGVIAGGPVRAVVEAAGIRDISSKILGSSNQASSVYATFEALRQIQYLVELKGIKLRSISEVEATEAAKVEAEQERVKSKAQESAAVSNQPTTEAKKVAPKKAAPKAAAEKKTAPKKAAAKKHAKKTEEAAQ